HVLLEGGFVAGVDAADGVLDGAKDRLRPLLSHHPGREAPVVHGVRVGQDLLGLALDGLAGDLFGGFHSVDSCGLGVVELLDPK
ncbi:hypothetical protein DK295_15495, partial [Listeria monocytogenes]